MLSKNAANFTVWLATILWLSAFGLLIEQLTGNLRIGAAMFVALAAVTTTVVWLADRIIDEIKELRGPVVIAPGWAPPDGSRVTVQQRRPESRFVSQPVPVPVATMDDGETTGQLMTQTKTGKAVRDDLYWEVYGDLLTDLMPDAAEDQEH